MRLKSLHMSKSAMICFKVAFGCLNYCLVRNAITTVIKQGFKNIFTMILRIKYKIYGK